MWGGKKSLNSSCCNIQKMKTKEKSHFLPISWAKWKLSVAEVEVW